MKWIKIFPLLLFLMGLFSIAIGQNPPTLESLDRRLDQLEKNKTAIEEIIEADIDYEKNADTITRHRKQEIDDKYAELKNNFLMFIISSILLGGVAIVGGIAFLKKIRKELHDKVDAKYTQKVDALIDNRRNDFLAMIDDKNIENTIRNHRKLLLLSTHTSHQAQIREIVEEFKFTEGNVKHRVYADEQTADEKVEVVERIKDADLIILNSPDGVFDEKTLEVVNQYPKKYFVNFRTGTGFAPRHERMNFANSKFTLYHAVMLTLKYRELQNNKNV